MRYSDGHEGWIVTRHELARAVLEDARFSQQPQRMPGGHIELSAAERELLAPLEGGNILALDAPEHPRIRRALLPRLSVRAVRGYEADVAAIVARRLEAFRALGSPADLWADFAQPVSAAVHCLVLGIPDDLAESFTELFVGESTITQKVAFVQTVLAAKRANPGDDLISDLLGSDFSDGEIEGLTFALFSSGRDSVAYLIATTTVALLRHPDQLEALRSDPSLLPAALEEFTRYGAMFITLFPRTATEDVDLDGLHIAAGESVSVSPVAANRDGRRFENPEDFDITRDAYGHLGFGHGIHGCVGQQLARLEMRQAMGQLLAGLPGLHLIEAEQLEPMPFAHPVATYEAGSVVVGWE